METRNVILGLEFGETGSRICVYDRTQREVVSLHLWGQSESFPTALAREKNQEIWYAGEDAVMPREDCVIVLPDQLTEYLQHTAYAAVGNSWYTPAELFAAFLGCILKKCGVMKYEKQLTAIMVTCRKLNRAMVDNLRKAYEILGIPRGKGYIQEYDESFFYHTIYQKPELWNQSVGAFYFSENTVSFRKLSISSRTKPATARTEHTDTYVLSGKKEFRDRDFSEIIRNVMGMESFSSIYLVGKGFSTEWAVESLKELGRKKCRIFGGENLFSSGACYAAREKSDEKNMRGILFMGNDLVRSGISMELSANGSMVNYVLINSGIHWYEAEKTCELILDDTDRLEFISTSMETGKVSKYTMHLDGMPKRPRHASRILLQMEFESPSLLTITVSDLGFGELFPSCRKIWKEEIRYSNGNDDFHSAD